MNAPPQIFDHDRRVHRGDRYGRGSADAPVFHARVTEDLLDRIDSVTRPLSAALLLNSVDPALAAGLAARGLAVTTVRIGGATVAPGERLGRDDQPPLPAGPFDLVVSPTGLDSINDVPGALSLWRAALKPDGLLLTCLPGAGSFAAAREACLAADLERGAGVARFHPLIDVRALGDLAARAGLVLPVVDVDSVRLTYGSLIRLFGDLREHGWASVLAGPVHPLTRNWLEAANARFMADAGPDGRAAERLNLLTLTAWSPGPDQPRPARRGTGTASLAAALRSGEAKA